MRVASADMDGWPWMETCRTYCVYVWSMYGSNLQEALAYVLYSIDDCYDTVTTGLDKHVA